MSDIEPVGIAVLGAADIAWRRTVPAIRRCAGLRLEAVASRTPEKARAFADAFDCEAVTGYERLLAREDVAAVYIPLPNALHEEWAEAALRAGKHVLVEKSLTTSAAAATALVRTAETAGLAFMENFAFLGHPQHDRVRELIADGVIGEPQVVSASFGIPRADSGLIRYSRELAGGALRETGCYPVRLAQLHLGDGIGVLGARLRYDPDSGVDVSGSVLLADSAGLTAQCDFGLTHAYRNTYAVWGSEGRIEVDWAFTPPPTTRPVIRLHRADSREERVLPAADQFLGAVTTFAEACADPSGHRRHGTDAVRQATLLESVVRRAGAADPAGPSAVHDARSAHVPA
ncbi:Gfo/Idh/MocA family oxidoreductase [Streptomyces sp. NBC_01267]|uniref:Gfo/Idh/MocA family protein n=1 Tax=Streptomyces sp. NBC_01267 TaxID=2903805 RepID=UPI002E34C9ED|nr:Gfo/Idh/MocA family oxidoreductase [Streptomyces sp. NBC_01267]